MIDYRTVFTNTDGVAFPNTKAVNVTTPGAGDGTEFIAAMVNDAWGARQALMDYTNLSPDTVTEAPGTSQMVDALRRGFGAPGEVVGWHGQADPATLGLRLLLLEGQGVLRANYPLLDAAVYCGDGNNSTWEAYYHADDAAGTSRNTAGIYLILADCRGRALRGHDPAGTIDPEGATRDFPDKQEGSLQAHEHEVETKLTNQHAEISTIPTAAGARSIVQPAATSTADAYIATFIRGGPNQNPDETRMINFQVKWCVRY
jgi:hypothetical protein